MRRVSATELHRYVSDKVPSFTQQRQRPTYFVNETLTGDIVLGRSADSAIAFDIGDPWKGGQDYGRLILQATPQDAEIFINGNYRGQGFINTLLREGDHDIRVVKSGHEDFTTSQQIGERSVSQLNVQLDAGARREKSKQSPPPP